MDKALGKYLRGSVHDGEVKYIDGVQALHPELAMYLAYSSRFE